MVTGDKAWIYLWAPLSKLEFMQWKDVDRRTFTRICNSAINCLKYGNSFCGIQTDCLWQTTCILERQLLVSITQSYSMSSSRNSDESCHLGVWLFHDNAPSSWNLVYRRGITEDRCEGMVWVSKQKILFPRHKQLGTKVENMHWCCMRTCQKMRACVI